jgi:hypothetical protein
VAKSLLFLEVETRLPSSVGQLLLVATRTVGLIDPNVMRARSAAPTPNRYEQIANEVRRFDSIVGLRIRYRHFELAIFTNRSASLSVAGSRRGTSIA